MKPFSSRWVRLSSWKRQKNLNCCNRTTNGFNKAVITKSIRKAQCTSTHEQPTVIKGPSNKSIDSVREFYGKKYQMLPQDRRGPEDGDRDCTRDAAY